MTGCNTDAEGFLDALADGGIELRGRVLLCGAGGVSAMMGTQALIHGCALTVAARTIGKAARFVDALKASFPGAQVDAAALPYLSGSYDLILNGTPAGMYPETKVSPVPSAVARSTKAVFDAIYNPCETQLMKTAREAGAKTVGGLRMLVRQAAAAQKLWNSSEFTQADIDRLCEEMAAYISEKF
jgi:shikimate dehydrogenase